MMDLENQINGGEEEEEEEEEERRNVGNCETRVYEKRKKMKPQ